MNLTLSVDEEVVKEARRRAEAMGTTVNAMVRQYLEQVAGIRDLEAEAEEFAQLSKSSKGDSKGWKYRREDLYDR
jgi:antitoxin component of RelBE/YafQ-DinJ toxin-antitoxin module